jgi:hypothetical protein
MYSARSAAAMRWIWLDELLIYLAEVCVIKNVGVAVTLLW